MGLVSGARLVLGTPGLVSSGPGLVSGAPGLVSAPSRSWSQGPPEHSLRGSRAWPQGASETGLRGPACMLSGALRFFLNIFGSPAWRHFCTHCRHSVHGSRANAYRHPGGTVVPPGISLGGNSGFLPAWLRWVPRVGAPRQGKGPPTAVKLPFT